LFQPNGDTIKAETIKTLAAATHNCVISAILGRRGSGKMDIEDFRLKPSLKVSPENSMCSHYGTNPAVSGCYAQLYRCHWQVELFLKWIKQHLRIKRLYGTTENAVKHKYGL